MSDIYLSITETPTVVTLTNPLISSNVAQSVTVTNVVSVNVVTMPAINVTAAAPAVTTVAGTVAVSNFPSVTTVAGTVALDANSLSALENVTVTVGAAVSVSNFPSTQTIAGTVTANGFDFNNASYHSLPLAPFDEPSGGGKAVVAKLIDDNGSGLNFSAGVPISGTVTANDSGALTIVNSSTVTKADVKFTAIAGAYNPTDAAPTYTLRPLKTTPSGTLLVDGTSSAGGSVIDYDGFAYVRVAQSPGSVVTIGSLPAISGTVTAAASNGSLTTRFGTPTTANTAFATSCVTNANRKYLLIQNVTTGSNVITVGIGFTPTTTQGIQLTAGAGITFESSYIPTGAVQILSSVTASNFTILEA